MDCQSNYFDCEYEEVRIAIASYNSSHLPVRMESIFQNENQKTDGGLGAGTPMFINEVMHGSACTII